jgi:hypothetical protein
MPPTGDGPLAWLPSAQQSYNLGLDLWEPLEARLTAALAGMREASFLICQVPGPTDEDGNLGTKYLQFALTDGQDGRQLAAEASALRFQGVLDPTAGAQQALIDAMGWTRQDNADHRRHFEWPLGVSPAVEQSMTILRDVWGVTHPSLVRIGEPTSFGHAPLSAMDDLGTVFTRLTSWVEALGGSIDTPEPDATYLLGSALDVIVAFHPETDEQRLEMQAVVVVLPPGHGAEAVILRAISDEALVGCARLTALESSEELLELTVSVPLEGLDATTFGQHLSWLAGSSVAVEQRLGGWPADESGK